MIEGLRLDITGVELQARLDERIEQYRVRTAALSGQLDRLAQPDLEDTRDDDESPYPYPPDSPLRSTRRRIDRLHARLTMLTFLREHLVREEVYRVDTDDLTLIEILPERSPLW